MDCAWYHHRSACLRLHRSWRTSSHLTHWRSYTGPMSWTGKRALLLVLLWAFTRVGSQVRTGTRSRRGGDGPPRQMHGNQSPYALALHPSAQVFKLNPAFKLNTIFVGLQSPLRVIFSPISPKVLPPIYDGQSIWQSTPSTILLIQ